MTTANAAAGRPRFDRLVASRRQGVFARSSRPALVSLLAHAAVIAAVAYASVHTRALAADETELITFTDIAPAQPREEKPEEEKPKPLAPRPAAPPPPQGTQALTPPSEPPAEIPTVDLSAAAVQVEDFSGMGTIGGVADGVEDAPPAEPAPAEESSGFAFESAVLEVQPELRNASQVRSLLERLYPPLLRDAEVGGVVTMRFVIQPDGSVDLSTVRTVDSPHPALSAASVEAVRHLRFRPGRYQGEYVRVIIQMPISWLPPR